MLILNDEDSVKERRRETEEGRERSERGVADCGGCAMEEVVVQITRDLRRKERRDPQHPGMQLEALKEQVVELETAKKSAEKRVSAACSC